MIKISTFNFQDFITYLENIGAYQYFLPFLLVFAIFFAILEKTKILGQDKTNINGVVAAIIGLLLVVRTEIVDTINLFLPRTALILIVILMFILVIATLRGKEFKGLTGILFFIGIVLVVLFLSLALTPSWSDWFTNYERNRLIEIGLPILAFIGSIIAIVAFGKSKGTTPEGGFAKFVKSIEDAFAEPPTTPP